MGTLDYMAPEVGNGMVQAKIGTSWFAGFTCWRVKRDAAHSGTWRGQYALCGPTRVLQW